MNELALDDQAPRAHDALRFITHNQEVIFIVARGDPVVPLVPLLVRDLAHGGQHAQHVQVAALEIGTAQGTNCVAWGEGGEDFRGDQLGGEEGGVDAVADGLGGRWDRGGSKRGVGHCGLLFGRKCQRSSFVSWFCFVRQIMNRSEGRFGQEQESAAEFELVPLEERQGIQKRQNREKSVKDCSKEYGALESREKKRRGQQSRGEERGSRA